MNRYEKDANFVRPAPVVERQQTAELMPMDGMLSGDSIHVGQPLAAHHGAHEQTSGMDRSLAWGVRLIPYTIIVMLLALTLTRLAGGSWLLGFVLFASLALGLYALLDYREHKYSRNGLELHKVDSLVYLKDKELDQGHELRKMWMAHIIEQNERGGDARTIEGTASDGSRTLTATQRRIASRD